MDGPAVAPTAASPPHPVLAWGALLSHCAPVFPGCVRCPCACWPNAARWLGAPPSPELYACFHCSWSLSFFAPHPPGSCLQCYLRLVALTACVLSLPVHRVRPFPSRSPRASFPLPFTACVLSLPVHRVRPFPSRSPVRPFPSRPTPRCTRAHPRPHPKPNTDHAPGSSQQWPAFRTTCCCAAPPAQLCGWAGQATRPSSLPSPLAPAAGAWFFADESWCAVLQNCFWTNHSVQDFRIRNVCGRITMCNTSGMVFTNNSLERQGVRCSR